MNTRNIYTTGQIATMCKVAPRLVTKWFDSGRLRGYRIPGTQDRRVPREYLLSFLQEYGMRIPEELQDKPEPPAVAPVEKTQTTIRQAVAAVLKASKLGRQEWRYAYGGSELFSSLVALQDAVMEQERLELAEKAAHEKQCGEYAARTKGSDVLGW